MEKGFYVQKFREILHQNDIILFKSRFDAEIENIKDTDRGGKSFLHIYTLVHHHYNYNKEEVLDFLLSKGLDINAITGKSDAYQTTLHKVVDVKPSLEMARLLLQRNAFVDIQDIRGNTPLWYAFMNYRGRKEIADIIELLLSYQADIHIKNYYNSSPFDLANNLKGWDLMPFIK
jgi:ankyrin repeat protein